MAGEFEVIARYFAPLAARAPGAAGLRDDGAVFEPTPGRDLVMSVDAMVAGVHFRPDDPPETVGRKLLRVNLSDLAAMGAAPRGYLLAAAFGGKIDEAWIAAFARGLARDQEIFHIDLYGGDTVATPGAPTFSLTAFGEVEPGRVLRRSGARGGDAVYVSGTIGDGALGLKALSGALPGADEAARAALAARYQLPEPRVALGLALGERGLASAAIDISDGLVADLGHIARTSGLGAVVDAAAVPTSAAAARVLAHEPELRQAILTGGDDYELLFTADPSVATELLELSEYLDLALTRIGSMEPGRGVRVVDAAGREVSLSNGGWTHF